MEKETMKQEVVQTEKETEEVITSEEFLRLKLSKTYSFEGLEISEVDLNALENLTGADILAIDRMMKKRGNSDASPEMTMEFAFFAAMQATKLPVEFFMGLNVKDAMKIKLRVNYFLMY